MSVNNQSFFRFYKKELWWGVVLALGVLVVGVGGYKLAQSYFPAATKVESVKKALPASQETKPVVVSEVSEVTDAATIDKELQETDVGNEDFSEMEKDLQELE